MTDWDQLQRHGCLRVHVTRQLACQAADILIDLFRLARPHLNLRSRFHSGSHPCPSAISQHHVSVCKEGITVPLAEISIYIYISTTNLSDEYEAPNTVTFSMTIMLL